MRASIIIPALNEGILLFRTVESLDLADLRDIEIIVVDDGSTDGSVAALKRRWPAVKVVAPLLSRGVSPARSRGAQIAKGATLIFLDAHCKPAPGALTALVTDVEAKHGACVITPQVAQLDAESWENKLSGTGFGYGVSLRTLERHWIDLNEMQAEGRWWESPNAIGCCLAVGRPLFDRVLGFDPDMQIWGVEDLDFGVKVWQMGGQILHNPNAIVGHRFGGGDLAPSIHCLQNKFRMARKIFSEEVWEDWLCRSFAVHDEDLWLNAWRLFQDTRGSAEGERSYLLRNRVFDEFWYADRFGQSWPQRSKFSDVLPSLFGNDHPASANDRLIDSDNLREFESAIRNRYGAQVRQPLCGLDGVLTGQQFSAGEMQIHFRLQVKRQLDGRIIIERASFAALGDYSLRACGNCLCDIAEGSPLGSVGSRVARRLIQVLGDHRCNPEATLAVNAFQSACDQL